MGSGRTWEDGRRAWDRLRDWHRDGSGGGQDGDGALDALDDVGALRRLLDQAELAAVRVARRHGRSWAEIATRLGVSRQSAWERWRDVDDAAEPAGTRADLAEGVIEKAAADAAEELTLQVEPAARDFRRRSSVRVPNVVGMTWADARGALSEEGLVAVGWDSDGLPLHDSSPSGVITDQSPESGAKVPRGASIRLWLYNGGGSAGVREPRRPRPDPKTARELRYEPSDEAVG